VGDVVRDLPAALAEFGWQATVLTPSYGVFSSLPGARHIGSLEVRFAGRSETVDVHEAVPSEGGVRQLVFEHPLFSAGGVGRIYCDQEDDGPFATDATRFALLGAVAARWIRDLETAPDVLHLHDWHAAFYCLFRSFAPDYEALAAIRTVFTIHNLSYQGTRPLDGHASSLAAWFPDLDVDPAVVGDPHSPGCINPMALAIRTCDRISTVSPTYAREILEPSDPARGFVGGEGLERQLGNAARGGRLVGILNGCDYSGVPGHRPDWQDLAGLAAWQVNVWRDDAPEDAAHRSARDRALALPKQRPEHVLVSIGRLVRQKVSLFLEELEDGRTALEHLLDTLGPRGILIMLGSGEPTYERRLTAIAQQREQLLFLRGYSEMLSEALYLGGDLFLMPSSFEPCGISQMLAMRAAQPVVAHATGGLCDTIEDDRTGFLFSGTTSRAQAAAFVARVEQALELKSNDKAEWENLRIRAASKKFDWASSARATIARLYEPQD